ncbi:unnamed protein product [Moneuplotes crassus]|uniref:Uncharacterized protein n=1 Tax=Euplotes crassus TaxID=5936 RepID=A0AAD1X9Q2_EUPCR|nr:unnamed protein product [Moneuplotes crassus]
MGKCPRDYKTCGSGEAKNQFCVKDSQPCPINDIIITDTTSEIPEGNYTKLSLDSNIVLAFTDTASKLPIVRTKLSQGEGCIWGFCNGLRGFQLSNEVSTPKDRTFYKLLKKENSTCVTEIADSYTDPRYFLVGEIREDRLYSTNGVSEVTKDLPFYPEGEEEFWGFYVNRYYEWSLECEVYYGVSRKELLGSVEGSGSVTDSLGVALLLGLLFFMLCAIFVCIFSCFDNNTLRYCNLTQKKPNYIILGMKIGLMLIILWCCLSNIISTISFNAVVRELEEAQCSDPFTDSIFSSYSEELSSSRGNNIFATIVSLAILAICSIYSYLVWKGKFDQFYDRN